MLIELVCVTYVYSISYMHAFLVLSLVLASTSTGRIVMEEKISMV